MFHQLPPAGNPIHLSGPNVSAEDLETVFSPYHQRLYASGTAALAAAIGVALRLRPVDSPEVILPAYGCPDLVSAAVFAGARPALVDLEPGRPWLDLDALENRITARTVAIIAVSLFGIPERMAALQAIAGRTGVLLIEDSAQSFPMRGEAVFWQGDLVVLSFGRGKPVGLLGGGAVLYRDPACGNLLAGVSGHASRDSFFPLKVWAYNLLTAPRLYWIPQGLPFLGLGATCYRPLPAVAPMEPERCRLLGLNIKEYQEDSMTAQGRVATLAQSLGHAGQRIINLPAVCRTPERRRLLRYPLLLEPDTRYECYRRLRAAGLGASLMYPASLPGIGGLESLLADQGEFPGAEEFASRILTLPVHGRVCRADIDGMQRILEGCVS